MILVTGGTGLVGSHLLWELIMRNEQVRAIYRTEESKVAIKELFEYKSQFTGQKQSGTLFFSKIEWINANINDIPALQAAFEQIEIVYHCAAFVSFDPAKFSTIQRINKEGTANMVNLSLKYGIVKFCHVSSVGALGNTEGNIPINESTFWTPQRDNSVYSISKFASETEVWRGTQEGLNAVIVNPAIILGEGFYKSGSGSFFTHIAKGTDYNVPGSTGFVDVLDVVEAMIKLMESDIHSERYILVGENTSYVRFFSLVAQNIDAKTPSKMLKSWQMAVAWRGDYLLSLISTRQRTLFRSSAQAAFGMKKFDSSKLKKALDFKYHDFEETIQRVGSHFKTTNS
ncbi:MAG: NAD-dependent epimerase/dehydratase family protein [Leeuwenhoekiella sp.]